MSTCPDIDVLREFEAGALSDERADVITPHVSGCQECGSLLERLRNDDLDSRVLRGALRDQSMQADPAASTIGLGTSAPDQSGRVWDIPDYERVRLCGSGAFGTVWAVRDRVGMHRALKTIDLSRLRAAQARCRESTALEAYCRRVQRHPNLIQIFHVGVQASVLYYTMELADDDATRTCVRDRLPETYRPLTLQRVIAKGPTSPDTAIEVVLRLLRGLARLHDMGLAHRDIKPANIVFVDRQPKLADIGMITSNTATPSQVGTPDYMPPDGRMDETGDVYAMGRVLYEMLVSGDRGTFPKLPGDFAGSSSNWNMARLGKVIEKACAPDGSDRYESADRMVEAVESCRELSYESLFSDLEPMSTAPARPQANPYVPVMVAAIHAAPWIIGALAVLVLVSKYL
ncbi:MAG: protein kinase [Phycisphaerae bacterium]